MNIDEEWENFISNKYNNDDTSSDDDEEHSQLDEILTKNDEDFISANLSMDIDVIAPKATDIYISTKTKIAYLNKTIDLKTLFWEIPILNYSIPKKGVVKKQMKFNSTLKEEVDFIQDKIKDEIYFEENVITHIDNPSGRIKFKDIRKVSIGISKKDLLSYRCKKKSAFYNCFVLILRMKIADNFKEFHVKVFNTGKLEIPGVQNETTFQLILQEVINTLQPYVDSKLQYKEDSEETVLINSNFNCGYFINREALYELLKFKYNIQAIYDPCPYPGIQCKFYYNPDVEVQTGCKISEENKELYKNVKEVSFMPFRTGSVLIVGNCNETILMCVYNFLKDIFTNEYKNICQKHSNEDELKAKALKEKSKKPRRKTMMIEFTDT